MTEWLKVRAWKVRIPKRVSWVRIPLSPQFVRPVFFGEADSVFLTAMQCGLNGPHGKGELLFD